MKILFYIYEYTLSSCSAVSRVVLSRYRLHSNSSDKTRSSHNVHFHRPRSTFEAICWTMTSLDAITMYVCFIYHRKLEVGQRRVGTRIDFDEFARHRCHEDGDRFAPGTRKSRSPRRAPGERAQSRIGCSIHGESVQTRQHQLRRVRVTLRNESRAKPCAGTRKENHLSVGV